MNTSNAGTARSEVRWHPFAESRALRDDAVRRVIAAAARAIDARGHFVIVLAGGATPRALYSGLRDADTDWSRWHVYFGDERCLAVDAAERNSVMAATTLLDHVPIPRSQRHAIPAELGATAGARMYSRTLHDVGEFDLVLLGLGEDGHVASLFPGHPADPENADAIAVFNAPKPPPERISLSAARLGRARAVLFLVSGESKREAVRRWRAGEDMPAREIGPPDGIDVLLDAGLLD